MSNKVSLAEAAKRMLSQKKQSQAAGKQHKGAPMSEQQVRSQITKKPNNQKRRTGV